jgi:hypothetical protein
MSNCQADRPWPKTNAPVTPATLYTAHGPQSPDRSRSFERIAEAESRDFERARIDAGRGADSLPNNTARDVST